MYCKKLLPSNIAAEDEGDTHLQVSIPIMFDLEEQQLEAALDEECE